MRRAAKKDSTQAAIVQALRAIGCVVLILDDEGVPDLLVCHRGRWQPVEVKNSPKAKLTKAQQETYQLAAFPVVSSVNQALDVFIGKLKW